MTMQTKQITVYAFSELDNAAKERVQQWILEVGHNWINESLDSVKAFAARFGVKLKNWELGTYCHAFIDTDADNSHFRGFTLAKARALPEYLTGYCLDSTLRDTFIKSFEKTGDAKEAFTDAIDASVRDIVANMKYQESEEAIAETCEANEYQFDQFGRII